MQKIFLTIFFILLVLGCFCQYDQYSGSFNKVSDIVGPGKNNFHASLKGFYTPGDGGGGEIYWNDTSTAPPVTGMIIQVPGYSTGRWIRIAGNELNIKWLGAKGIGLPGYQQDSAAITAAIGYLNSLNGGSLYFPGTSSFYGLNGDGILLGDNIEMYGDGYQSEIRVVNPESATYYKGAGFYTTSYFTADGQNPFKICPSYPIFDAVKGVPYLKLRSIADTVHFPAGRVFIAGARAALKTNAKGISQSRRMESDINEVLRIHLDTLFLKYPTSSKLTADTGYARLFSVNEGNVSTGTILGTGVITKNISIHDLTLAQSNYNMITGKPYDPTQIPPLNFLAGGGTFNSKFYNLKLEGYGTFGGNLFGHCQINNLVITGAIKLLDFGFSSCEDDYTHINWKYSKTLFTNNDKTTASVYINDGTHEINISDIRVNGEWSGNNFFSIANGAKYIYIDNVTVNLPSYRNPNAAMIKIDEDTTSEICDNIYIMHCTFKVDSVGRWIDVTGVTGADSNRVIYMDDLKFKGHPNHDSSFNTIRIKNAGSILLKNISADEADTVVFNGTSSIARMIDVRAPDAYLNSDDVTKVQGSYNFGSIKLAGIALGRRIGLVKNQNTFIGVSSGDQTTTGLNASVGASSLSNVNGTLNAVTGFQSLKSSSLVTIDSVAAIGGNTFNGITGDVTASSALGTGAGAGIYGRHNVYLGAGATQVTNGDSASVALGYGSKFTTSNQFALADKITSVKWRGVVYSLPAAQGGVNMILQNDGTGGLSWAAQTGQPPVVAYDSTDQTSTSGSPGAISGLSIAVAAGKSYKLKALLLTGCSTANGVKIAVNVSGSGAALKSGVVMGTNTTVTSIKWARLPDIAGTSAGTFNNAATATGMVTIEVYFTTTNTGNAVIKFGAGIAGDTATIFAGSTMELTTEQPAPAP